MGRERTDWIEATLQRMTLEQEVGQLLFPYLSAVFMNKESQVFQEIQRNITEFHVGGYHAFSGDPAALALMLNRMQEISTYTIDLKNLKMIRS